MTQYLFLHVISDKCQQKHRVPGDTEQAENSKSAERQKSIFPKVSVQNTGLYIPVLNKIMTKDK